jgi:hypothetical protein
MDDLIERMNHVHLSGEIMIESLFCIIPLKQRLKVLKHGIHNLLVRIDRKISIGDVSDMSDLYKIFYENGK